MSKGDYDCPVCRKLRMPDRSKLQVGDWVSYVISTQRGSQKSLRLARGKIESITGDKCAVRSRGQQMIARRDDLMPDDAPSLLTYGLIGVCKCDEQKEG